MNFKTILILILVCILSIQCNNVKNKKVSVPVRPKKVQYLVKENTVTDIDGNSYNSVVINDLEWMTSNLRVTRLNDGTPINFMQSDEAWGDYSGKIYTEGPNYYSIVNKDSLLTVRYGLYYNVYTVETEKLCPDGWHVASRDEWYNLLTFTRKKDEYPEKELRSKIDWNDRFLIGNDTYKLNILPAGFRDENGKIQEFGEATGFWTSSTLDGNTTAVFNDGGTLGFRDLPSAYGQPVRCVKDKIRPNAVTDIDGNVYSSVMIGKNEWLATNLRVSHLNDGTPIKQALTAQGWENQTSTPYYSRIVEDTLLSQKYGIYYNYSTILSNKICPKGWHLATEEEWQDAIQYIGARIYPKDPLEEMRTLKGWDYDRMSGSDVYKLGVLPSGYRDEYGDSEIGYSAYFWVHSKDKQIKIFDNISGKFVDFLEFGDKKEHYGIPIRCVKDKIK
jgi:uncharacterized protein (TIGR02145 family)